MEPRAATLALVLLVGSTAHADLSAASTPVSRASNSQPSAQAPADTLLEHFQDGELRRFAADVLDRAPELQALRHRIRALEQKTLRAGLLPDPTVRASLFALPVETRVGPQRLSISAQQDLPRKAERELETESIRLETAKLEAERQALRLCLLTRARELWIELAFVREHQRILDQKRDHLLAHEAAARVRYASGKGSAMGPLKLQTELTRLDVERLTVAERLPVLRTEMAALRDRLGPSDGDMENTAPMPELADLALPDSLHAAAPSELAEKALRGRPEMWALELERRHAALGVEKVALERKPDWRVGLAFTAVDSRRDDAGRISPPEGNGDDILALTAGVSLPVRSARYDSMLGEAAEREAAVGATARSTAAEIRRHVAELAARLPLETQQLSLLEGVLVVQSEESVRAAVAGYGTGNLGVLDLLDAEHRLFEVRLAAARARADVALVIARLEGQIAASLTHSESASKGDAP